MFYIPYEWIRFIGIDEFKKPYFVNMMNQLEEEYQNYTIFPEKENVFRALYIDPKYIKVVILGQDPYHEEHQATGFAFSVHNSVKVPPSLQNILKELKREGFEKNSSSLIGWAKQGVLLLNTVLTVREGEANSHKDIGWEIFTDKIIQKINESENPIVFMLWGKQAQEKKKFLNNPEHLILESTHPSPLSAMRTKTPFIGNNHFKMCNSFLEEHNEKPIEWTI